MKKLMILFAFVLLFSTPLSYSAEDVPVTQVLTAPYQEMKDLRVTHPRTLDDFFQFPRFASKEEWMKVRQDLETHIWVSMGCYPQPPRTDLNVHIFDRVEHEDYTVEKVYFESYPDFCDGKSLSSGKQGPFPQFWDRMGTGVRSSVNSDSGSVPHGNQFCPAGICRSDLDMIGYVDSRQLGHTFADPQRTLWGISLHGLQFWNSIRAVDFLLTLPDVDPSRIACTGASGGGTQTFFLMAVDPRIQAAAPVNMISLHMQGGCECENAPSLRIHANNAMFASLMAPRPLLMIAATGDWTDETPWVEYPAIRSIYELYGVPERVHFHQVNAPHNYNKQSREQVYEWFANWLLDNPEEVELREQPFELDEESKLRVFPEGQELPESAVSGEELRSTSSRLRKSGWSSTSLYHRYC